MNRMLRNLPAVRLGLCAALLTGLAGCGSAASSSAGAAGERARDLYDKGQFRESQELLLQVTEQVGPSAAILYNLGCAYFRQGRLGEAIAAWETARRLDPRDADVLNNLRVASERQVDRLPAVDRGLAQEWLDRAVGWLSLDEWSTLVYVAYLLVLGCVGVRVYTRDEQWRDHAATATFFAVLLLGLAALGWAQAWSGASRAEAVIVADEVTLFSGPERSGTKVATVHAGLVVQVLGSAGQDREVRLPTGWQGFVPADALHGIGVAAWSGRE